MPPRLPARQSVELVQLGFLLPWAGKRGASSIPDVISPLESNSSSVGTSSHAESSKMAASRPRQAISTGPSLPTHTKRSTRRLPSTTISNIKQSTSVIHQYLSSPNPPPPSSLLNLLRAHSHQLTLSSGKALSSYCIRMGDLKSYRGIWRLMGERRVAIVSLVRYQLMKKFEFPPNKRTVEQEDIVTSHNPSLEIGDGGESTISDKGYRPNRWAMKMFPPLPTLPSSQRYTKLDLLRHLHYLLLQGDSPDFKGSLELYHRSLDWNISSGDPYQSLGILNLYLAYLNRLLPHQNGDKVDGMGLIDIYLNNSPGGKVNKQTLHLLIKSLIPLTIPKKSMLSTISEEPRLPESKLGFIKNRILATISYFLHRHRIIPGPETWRIISNFAIRYKIEELAQLTWEGWNDSLNQEINEYSPLTKRPLYPSSSLLSSNVNDMNPSECGLDDVLDNPVFRFRRIGNYKKRWTGILQLYQEIGWLVKDENAQVEFSNEMNHGYAWLGEKGRLGKLAQSQLQKEKEKELKMETVMENQVVMEEIKLQDLNANVTLNLDLEQLRINETTQREEVKINIQKFKKEDEPIIQIVPEPQQEASTPSASETLNFNSTDGNILDNDSPEQHHHKPPYFVLIRDGSTIKIKSRDRSLDHSRLDEVEDKPVWE